MGTGISQAWVCSEHMGTVGGRRGVGSEATGPHLSVCGLTWALGPCLYNHLASWAFAQFSFKK